MAAGILLVAKMHLKTTKELNMPEVIHDHPWYKYVDPEISDERIDLFRRVFEEELAIIRHNK